MRFLQQCVKSICTSADSIPTRYYVTLLNLSKRAVRYAELQKVLSEELPLYLRASVAMPIYNRAVQIGQESYYDGAMVDNIPVYPLLADPPNHVLCLHFDETSYTFETDGFDRRVIKLTYPALHCPAKKRAPAPKLRVTGDVLVTNRNRVPQKFANRTLK